MSKSLDKIDSLWQEMVKTMVLGTERIGSKGLSPLPKAVLSNIVEINQLRRAQGNFTIQKPPSPTLDPSSLNQYGSLNSNSIHHLNLILDGTFPDALEEFILLSRTHHLQLPPESLPTLLNECLLDHSLWEKIQPILGVAGSWLAEQNPDWHSLNPEIHISDWASEHPERKMAAFAKIRREDAQLAQSLLERNWLYEKLSSKLQLLELLQPQISSIDLPFLKNCLLDEDQTIRHQAAKLLILLPESGLLDHVINFAISKIEFSQTEGILIDLPNQIPEELLNLISNKKEYRLNKVGKKTNQFYQLLSLIPPKFWEELVGTNPLKTLKIIQKSNWNEILYHSILVSTYNYKDDKWTHALAHFWLSQSNPNLWQLAFAKKIIQEWPTKLFNQIVQQYFNFNPNLPEASHLILHVLSSGKVEWEDRTAKRVIQCFQNWLSSTQSISWRGDQFQPILTNAAYRINPSLFEAFQSNWPTYSRLWGVWQRRVETFMQILLFRKEMIHNLRG